MRKVSHEIHSAEPEDTSIHESSRIFLDFSLLTLSLCLSLHISLPLSRAPALSLSLSLSLPPSPSLSLSLPLSLPPSLMFWTNWNEQSPCIMRSTLSGAHILVILSNHMRT